MEPAHRDERMAEMKESVRVTRALRRRLGSGELSLIELRELAGPKVDVEGDRRSGASARSEDADGAMIAGVVVGRDGQVDGSRAEGIQGVL